MMRVPVRPPARPGRDHRDLEDLERARDVDALAAGEGEHVARAVAEADLEHRNRERAVERRVRRHRDDHVTSSQRFLAVCVAVPLCLRPQPCIRDRVGCDQVRRRDEPVPVVDLDAAQALPLRNGQRERRRRDDSLDERRAQAHGSHECARGDELDRRLPVPRLRPRVRRARRRRPGPGGTDPGRTRGAPAARRSASYACRCRAPRRIRSHRHGSPRPSPTSLRPAYARSSLRRAAPSSGAGRRWSRTRGLPGARRSNAGARRG